MLKHELQQGLRNCFFSFPLREKSLKRRTRTDSDPDALKDFGVHRKDQVIQLFLMDHRPFQKKELDVQSSVRL